LRHLFRRVGAGLQRPSNENARPGGAAGASVTDHGITTVIGGDVGEVAILRVGGEDVGLQHGLVFQVNLCPLDTVDGAATRVTGDGHDRPGRTVAIVEVERPGVVTGDTRTTLLLGIYGVAHGHAMNGREVEGLFPGEDIGPKGIIPGVKLVGGGVAETSAGNEIVGAGGGPGALCPTV